MSLVEYDESAESNILRRQIMKKYPVDKFDKEKMLNKPGRKNHHEASCEAFHDVLLVQLVVQQDIIFRESSYIVGLTKGGCQNPANGFLHP